MPHVSDLGLMMLNQLTDISSHFCLVLFFLPTASAFANIIHSVKKAKLLCFVFFVPYTSFAFSVLL